MQVQVDLTLYTRSTSSGDDNNGRVDKILEQTI